MSSAFSASEGHKARAAKIPATSKINVTEAGARILALYEALGQAGQGTEVDEVARSRKLDRTLTRRQADAKCHEITKATH
jgi:hypothetical protein